jgi:hypothetical protein
LLHDRSSHIFDLDSDDNAALTIFWDTDFGPPGRPLPEAQASFSEVQALGSTTTFGASRKA